MLGSKAKALEPYVRKGIQEQHPYAVEAAERLLHIEEETVVALAEVLNQMTHGNYDAARALIVCGEHRNPTVLKILANNSNALGFLEWVSEKT